MRMTLLAMGVAAALTGTAWAQGPPLTTEDQVQIQQLYARFSLALDSGAENGQAFARLFTPDGSYTDETGRTIAGVASLSAHAASAAGGPTSVKHFVYNVWVEPAPDGATGRAYVVMATLNESGAPATVIDGGQYHDRLVRTADGWRFGERRFERARR